jgi:hypothetical protein
MNLPWRREPLTGEPLIEEAQRLNVSLSDLPFEVRLKPGGRIDPANEPEIRRRIQIARSDRRLNRIQSVGIVLGLVLTAGIALWHGHVEAKRESADMMLKFDERLSSGASRPVATALEMMATARPSRIGQHPKHLPLFVSQPHPESNFLHGSIRIQTDSREMEPDTNRAEAFFLAKHVPNITRRRERPSDTQRIKAF